MVAQSGCDANPAVTTEVPASSNTSPQSNQGDAMMAAVMEQLALLQAQVQSLTAQNAELLKKLPADVVQSPKFSQYFDEEVPEHDAENAGKAAASADAPKVPAMPTSFAMTPERRRWMQHGQADSDAYTHWIPGGPQSAAPAPTQQWSSGKP